MVEEITQAWQRWAGRRRLCALALAPAAQAEDDFLSALFGAFGGGHSPQTRYHPLPFGNEGQPAGPQDLPAG